jgi:hypothetical protein
MNIEIIKFTNICLFSLDVFAPRTEWVLSAGVTLQLIILTHRMLSPFINEYDTDTRIKTAMTPSAGRNNEKYILKLFVFCEVRNGFVLR